MAAKRKPQPRHVNVTITCPESGAETVDLVETPHKKVAAQWLEAAAGVDAALCGCGRPHHAVYSDDPPHTYPQPITLHRTGTAPTLGVAL